MQSNTSSKQSLVIAAAHFRAAIVSTWIAVVLDILDKLRELSFAGHADAAAKIDEFERFHAIGESTGDWKRANDFERRILDVAKDPFELLTHAEHVELSRIRDDRNRCAHPSLQSETEPYQPSAELARYHIRNAVMYLLSQSPVQGKAAISRIVEDIESIYFPRSQDAAQQKLASGPLGNTRQALVRNLAIRLLKTLLLQPGNDDARARRVSALGAIRNMHRAVAEATLQAEFAGIVNRVADDDWRRVIWFIRHVPDAWTMLDAALQDKARLFVSEVPVDVAGVVVADALQVPALATIARSRLSDVPVADLMDLLQSDPSEELAQIAVHRFAQADSFREAYELGSMLLLPSVPFLTCPLVQDALRAYVSNDQINGSGGMIGILDSFFDQTSDHVAATATEWAAVHEVLLAKASLGAAGDRLVKKLEDDVIPLLSSSQLVQDATAQ